MLLFPFSYRVGHHRHRFCLPRRARVPFMSLSYTLHLVSPLQRRRCNAPILRTENFNGPTASISIESNFFQQRESRARATFHDDCRCRWMTMWRLLLDAPRVCVYRGVYRTQLFQLSFPFLALAMTALRFDPARATMECEILTARRTTRANEMRCKQVRATIALRSTVMRTLIEINSATVKNFSQPRYKILTRDCFETSIFSRWNIYALIRNVFIFQHNIFFWWFNLKQNVIIRC